MSLASNSQAASGPLRPAWCPASTVFTPMCNDAPRNCARRAMPAPPTTPTVPTALWLRHSTPTARQPWVLLLMSAAGQEAAHEAR